MSRTSLDVSGVSEVDLIANLRDRGGFLWSRFGEGFVGWGEAARIDLGTGPERFARAAAVLPTVVPDEHPEGRLIAFASFTFDEEVEGSVVVVPQVLIETRAGSSRVTSMGGDAIPKLGGAPTPTDVVDGDRVRYAGSSLSELRWLEAVARATEQIATGALAKVVLARDVLVWSKEPFRASVLTRRLAARFPQCFTFAFDGFVGATPELLLRKSGADVESVVLAGSAPRGRDDREDAEIGADLKASAKDRREHYLAVGSVRSVLDPICDEVAVDPEPSLLKLANVQHLATGVRGRVDPRVNVLQIVGELHPTAAVCGTPRARALGFIRSAEGMDRGRYGGPIGWVDRDGNGEWGIALRCAQIDGGRARLFAGAGIVEGSIPEHELEETRLKLQAMQSALDPTA